MSASYSALERQRSTNDQDHDSNDHRQDHHHQDHHQALRVKSPMSQSEEDLEAEEADLEREEFVDAPDSQYALQLYRTGAMDHNLSEANTQPPSQRPKSQRPTEPPIVPRRGPQQAVTPPPQPRMRTIIPQSIPLALFSTPTGAPTQADTPTAAELKWRKRVESSLMKMTAEVAALREQLEARRLFQHRVHYRFFRAIWRFVWASAKHIAIDLLVLALVLGWMRRKGDRRMEGAVRVLLGDAVAQVQGLRGGALGNLPKVPALPIPKLSGLGKKGS